MVRIKSHLQAEQAENNVGLYDIDMEDHNKSKQISWTIMIKN